MPEPVRLQKGSERFYKIGGREYPSVTTILNAYGPKKKAIEAANVPDEYVDYAALRGTLAHHRILDPYAIRSLPLPQVDFDVVRRWGKTPADLHAELEVCDVMWDNLDFDMGTSPYIEQKIVSHEHGYAGTLDVLTHGGVDERLVADLKTSKGAFDSHKLQAAAYFHAAIEIAELPDPDGAAIIVLHPDPDGNPTLTPKVERMDRDVVDHWFDIFLGVLSDYRRQSKII